MSAPEESLDRLVQTGFGAPVPKDLDRAFAVAAEAVPPKARTDRTLVVCRADELPVGSRRIVRDGARSIGVFHLASGFHALLNACPHMGAELCAGHVGTTHRPGPVHEFEPALEGRVLHCPWHGWEFDIVTGKGLYDLKSRVAIFPVGIDAAGDVVVRL